MCGVCNNMGVYAWVFYCMSVCVGFVLYGCVYVWVLLCIDVYV